MGKYMRTLELGREGGAGKARREMLRSSMGEPIPFSVQASRRIAEGNRHLVGLWKCGECGRQFYGVAQEVYCSMECLRAVERRRYKAWYRRKCKGS